MWLSGGGLRLPLIRLALGLLCIAPSLFAQTAPDYRAVLNKYCVTCHNDKTKTGGLTLADIDLNNIPANADIWEKVIRKVRVGMMPPQGLPHPDAATRDALVSRLQDQRLTVRAAAAHPNPGAGLSCIAWNRTEYANAIRDLQARARRGLGIPASCPTIPATASTTSPTSLASHPVLLGCYLSAPAKISALAVGDPGARSCRARLSASGRTLLRTCTLRACPSAPSVACSPKPRCRLMANTSLQPTLFSHQPRAMRGLEYPEPAGDHRVDGERVHLAPFGGDAGLKASLENITAAADAVEARRSLRACICKAGPHEIGVAFLERSATQNTLRLQSYIRSSNDTLDPAGHPHLLTFTVTGPFNPTGSGDTPSRRQIFTCRPGAVGQAGSPRADGPLYGGLSRTGSPAINEEIPCARKILASLSHRAYRGLLHRSRSPAPYGNSTSPAGKLKFA